MLFNVLKELNINKYVGTYLSTDKIRVVINNILVRRFNWRPYTMRERMGNHVGSERLAVCM